jgi:hypothetical protein
LGKLKIFIGCKTLENDKRDTIGIHHTKLLKHLKQTFGELVSEIKEYKTPTAPKTSIIWSQLGDPSIDPEKQNLFRSGIGMLLYLIKHSRPDISNSTRELSKVADGETEAHWKFLLRTIKYVINTESKALKLTPKNKGDMFYFEGLSDSNFA